MILQEEKTYTFSQIFELNFETEEILAELGYTYTIRPLNLPRANLDLQPTLKNIQSQMQERLPYVPLGNETARREFYVSPVLFTALDQAKFKMSIEYNIAGDRLQGTVDYLLRGGCNLVVVEAKRADMERGFTQLAAEMIAFSEYHPKPANCIYGAVTTGDLWQFGLLDKERKTISKDSEEYLLPKDLENVVSILLGLLE